VQKKKDKRTNNDLKNTTHETKDGTTGIPLNTRGELWCSGRVSSSYFTYEFRRITLVTKPVIMNQERIGKCSQEEHIHDHLQFATTKVPNNTSN
jgi:hypothetical protein